MSCGGGGSNTVVQQSSPPPQFLAAYQNVLNGAQQVASQGYQPYGGQIVAGLSPDQLAGIGSVENLQGASLPWLGAAGQYVANSTTPVMNGVPGMPNSQVQGIGNSGWNYLQQAAQPNIANAAQQGAAGVLGASRSFTPGSVSAWQDPYTQQVVDATSRQFQNQNAQQNQNIIGNAAASGAWGGDRAGVAQGIAAGQEALAQAPVIAGRYNQGYQTALGAAQTQAGLGLQGATTAGQMGLQGATSQSARTNQVGQEALGFFGNQQQRNLGANEANRWLNSQAAFGASNIGNQRFSQGRTGANALRGVGGMEQNQAQAYLNVPYEQYLAQQAYPFQTTGWLAGISEGLGGASGGSSSSRYPGPNVLSQAAGLGMTGLAMNNLAGNPVGGWINGSNYASTAGGAAGNAWTDAQDAANNMGMMQSGLNDVTGSGSLVARGGAIPERGIAAGARRRAGGGGIAGPNLPMPRQEVMDYLDAAKSAAANAPKSTAKQPDFASDPNSVASQAAAAAAAATGSGSGSTASPTAVTHGAASGASSTGASPQGTGGTAGLAAIGHAMGIAGMVTGIPGLGLVGLGRQGLAHLGIGANNGNTNGTGSDGVGPGPAGVGDPGGTGGIGPGPAGVGNPGGVGGDGGSGWKRGGIVNRDDGGDIPGITDSGDVPDISGGGGQADWMPPNLPVQDAALNGKRPAPPAPHHHAAPPAAPRAPAGPPPPPASEPGDAGIAGSVPAAPPSQHAHTDPNMALLYAGLGIMSGRSPFALSNIGGGALEGLKLYDAERLRQQQQESLDWNRMSQVEKRQADERARQATLDEDHRHHQADEDHQAASLAQQAAAIAARLGIEGANLDETRRYHTALEGQGTMIGTDADGNALLLTKDNRIISTKTKVNARPDAAVRGTDTLAAQRGATVRALISAHPEWTSDQINAEADRLAGQSRPAGQPGPTGANPAANSNRPSLDSIFQAGP